LPAQTISQRPDVFAAERDVVLASAQVGSAKAQQWPRLSLNGCDWGAAREHGHGETSVEYLVIGAAGAEPAAV
jgi:multidrug efflux system outer membrane protein